MSANVTLPGGSSMLVVSIHNPVFPISRSLLTGRDLTGIKLTLNDDLWLLDLTFHFLTRRLNGPLLVGGDFNYSRLLDEPRPRGNAEFLDSIASGRFTSLHRRIHDRDEQIFFHPRRRPHCPEVEAVGTLSGTLGQKVRSSQ